MDWLKLRRIAEYVAFRGLVAVVWRLPVLAQRALAWSLATLLCRVLPKRMTRYDIATNNLRLSFGQQYSDAELDRILFDMWQHLVRLVCEMVQFPKWSAGVRILRGRLLVHGKIHVDGSHIVVVAQRVARGIRGGRMATC